MELTVVATETDGHTQGYNNPPVLRRLFGGSHIPPGLSPAYTRSSENMPSFRLAGELKKKKNLNWNQKQVLDLVGYQGPTYTGPLAEPSGQSTRNTVTTGLSGPAVHV